MIGLVIKDVTNPTVTVSNDAENKDESTQSPTPSTHQSEPKQTHQKERKARAFSGPRRCRNRSIRLLSKQAITVLSRDLDRLLDRSFEDSLDKEDANKLINYLKLLNDIRKLQAKEPGSQEPIPIEVLQKIADSEPE